MEKEQERSKENPLVLMFLTRSLECLCCRIYNYSYKRF